MRVAWARKELHFKFLARTSRESMTERTTWYVKMWSASRPEFFGIGECAHFPGLSPEPTADFEQALAKWCRGFNARRETVDIGLWPSIAMGAETAAMDLMRGGKRVIYPTPFAAGEEPLEINGLVWMGSADEMLERIDAKLAAGFRCLKMKIGGVDFSEELRLLRHVRRHFDSSRLTVRLDANGAFAPGEALEKLHALSEFDIHSIEQPVKAGQRDVMARLCKESPIPIALDEELIGVRGDREQFGLLDTIRPHYIILKPTLLGGFGAANGWVGIARHLGIGYWATSALESNIGLNAIAQYASALGLSIPQGLGTGQLYTDNVTSPLRLEGDRLSIDPDGTWEIPDLEWHE